MRKQSGVQRIFQDRFFDKAEQMLGMSRNEWGFMSEVAKSLKLKRVSVVQRWFEGWMPRVPHLLKINKEWRVTPNEMLGIDETRHKLDIELRLKLFFFFR